MKISLGNGLQTSCSVGPGYEGLEEQIYLETLFSQERTPSKIKAHTPVNRQLKITVEKVLSA